MSRKEGVVIPMTRMDTSPVVNSEINPLTAKDYFSLVKKAHTTKDWKHKDDAESQRIDEVIARSVQELPGINADALRKVVYEKPDKFKSPTGKDRVITRVQYMHGVDFGYYLFNLDHAEKSRELDRRYKQDTRDQWEWMEKDINLLKEFYGIGDLEIKFLQVGISEVAKDEPRYIHIH